MVTKEVPHLSGTESSEVLLSSDPPSSDAWMGSQETYIVLGDGYPVSYEGGKPVIDPDLMAVHVHYPLRAYGEMIWVVKGLDESLNFYCRQRS